MPNIKLPRMPKIATIKGMDPVSVLSAMADTEKDALDALVREPLQSLGVALPAPPDSPSGILARMAGQLPKPQSILNIKTGGGKYRETETEVERPKITEVAPSGYRFTT